MSPNKSNTMRSPSPFRSTSPPANGLEDKIDGRVGQGSDVLSTYMARATRESKAYLDQIDDDNATFRTYINWIYTRKLATKGPDEWIKLCRLFILAEKLKDVEAKNAIIDAMHSFLRDALSLEHSRIAIKRDSVKEANKGELSKEPQSNTSRDTKAFEPQIHASPESIRELYKETPEGSSARKLVADLYADNGKEEWLKGGKGILPPEFWYDVVASMLQKNASNIFNLLFEMRQKASYYHESNSKTSGSGLRVP